MGMEMLLAFAVGIYIIWELVGIISSVGKIKVSATIFGRWISMGLIAALMALAIFRNRENLQYYWFVFVGMGVSAILYAFMKSGLGEQGLYFNGHFIQYTVLKSYYLDRETESKVAFRFEGKRKEYVLEFPTDQKELVIAYMMRAKVPPSELKKKTQGNSGK